MNIDRNTYVRDQLRHMAETDLGAHAFFTWLATYSYNTSTSTVDVAQQGSKVYAETEVSRAKIIRIMRRLDELKLGTFMVGRRGAESRFEFWTSRKEIGNVALGSSNDIEIVGEPAFPTEGDIIRAYRTLLASALGRSLNAVKIEVKDA